MTVPADAIAARAQSLLAGPRGRRMLLELAISLDARAPGGEGERPLQRTVLLAALALDPALSPVPVTKLVGFSGEARALSDLPQLTPADVAAQVLRVGTGGLTEPLLRAALAGAAAYAVHWDAPFAEEALAATGPVVSALTPLATAVAASPLVSWWYSPVAEATQLSVTWRDAPFADPLAAERDTLAAAILVVRENEGRAQSAAPADPAEGVLEEWRSTPPSTVPESTRAVEGHTPLRLFCYEEGFKEHAAQVRPLEVPDGLHIAEIDSAQAWAELCRRFPCTVTHTVRYSWAKTTGRDGPWVVPDWDAVANEFDGVHLQAGAYLAASGAVIEVDADRASMIAGWDADETFWFSSRVRYRRDAERWERVGEGADALWRVSVPPDTPPPAEESADDGGPAESGER